MAKRVKVPISSARSDLFKLAELVRQSRDATVVVLEGRGGIEPVALVREARLAYLEERVAQMDTTNTAQPFSLAGSLASGVDDATLASSLLELRRAWSKPADTEPPAPPSGSAVSRRRRR